MFITQTASEGTLQKTELAETCMTWKLNVRSYHKTYTQCLSALVSMLFSKDLQVPQT